MTISSSSIILNVTFYWDEAPRIKAQNDYKFSELKLTTQEDPHKKTLKKKKDGNRRIKKDEALLR